MSISIVANTVVTLDADTAYAVKVTNSGTTPLVIAADDGERAKGGWELDSEATGSPQSFLAVGASRLIYPGAFVPVTAAAWTAGNTGQVDVTVYSR